jgi:hypothetical protein
VSRISPDFSRISLISLTQNFLQDFLPLDFPYVAVRDFPGFPPGFPDSQDSIRFQTSEGRRAGIDDKVAADQRRHTVGVALSAYAQTAVGEITRAVEAMESHLYGAAPQQADDMNSAVKQ